jgi:excinuclease ABC subunit A
LLIPDPELSLNEGAIAVSEWSGPKEEGGYYWQSLEAAAHFYDIDLRAPVRTLPQEKLDIIFYGTRGKEIPITYKSVKGHEYVFDREFEGVIGNLMRRYNETNSEYMREKIGFFMSMRTCSTCGGKRLRREAMAVTVDDKNIVEITEWPILQTLEWVEHLIGISTPLNSRQQTIAERILKEIDERLGFLVDVGLDYLSLRRSAGSLSGGEAQRIRLATQIGSRLMGVLYVLDEPSIGLHPRDNTRLLRTLKGLRDLGNSVIVVEHDSETILSADWILDLGPGAGEHGGKVVAEGTVDHILENPDSLTGAYLSGRLQVDIA